MKKRQRVGYMADQEERVRAGYGAEKYSKLVELKDKWDPENLFRVNQNIKPSRETHVPTPA
jgi:Berberine and berberine like